MIGENGEKDLCLREGAVSLYLHSGRDCVKPLRSSYTGLYPQSLSLTLWIMHDPFATSRGYRGTSLIRNTHPVGPCSNPMPRDL